jgi:hypothetical protein
VLSLASKKQISSVAKTEWENWAQQLRRWGLSSFVAAFLESGSAFATLAAQSLYVAQPLLEPWMPEKSLSAFAGMLADPQQSAAFAQFLREQAK